jgi:hypothetical protein
MERTRRAKEGLAKGAEPNRFCPAKGCLWHTDGTHCLRHAPFWNGWMCRCEICIQKRTGMTINFLKIYSKKPALYW